MRITFFKATTSGSQTIFDAVQSIDELSGIVNRKGQARTELPDRFGSFDQAAVWELPGTGHENPLRDNQANEFGIDFAQDSPWVLAAPFIDFGMTFPKFEKEFYLPAHAQHDQSLG
jgi:hypothetical protein